MKEHRRKFPDHVGPLAGRSKKKTKKVSNLLQMSPDVHAAAHGATLPTSPVMSRRTPIVAWPNNYLGSSSGTTDTQDDNMSSLPTEGQHSTLVAGAGTMWRKRSYRPSQEEAHHIARMADIDTEDDNMTALPTEAQHSTLVAEPAMMWKKRSYRPCREEARLIARMAGTGQIAPENRGKRNGRGPNKPENLKPRYGEQRWKIYFSKTYKPLGSRTVSFAEYIGDQARNHHHFPIHKRWCEESNRQLLRVLKEATQHYEFIAPEDPDPERKGQRLPLDKYAVWIYFKKALQKALREWRHKVKMEFYDRWLVSPPDYRKIVEREVTALCRIPLEDWPAICQYFSSDKFKTDSIRNRSNRNAETDRPTSTSGSVSHARTCEKLKDEMGDEYNDMYGFDYCHTSKDPTTKKRIYPDKRTERYLDKFHEKAQEKGLIPSCEPGASNLTPILEELSGQRRGGYEIGWGLGPSKKTLKDSHVRITIDSMEDERKRWASEREEYEKKIRTLEAKNEELNAVATHPSSVDSIPSASTNPAGLVNPSFAPGFGNADLLRLLFGGTTHSSPTPNMGLNQSIGEMLAAGLSNTAFFSQGGQSQSEELNHEMEDD